MYLEMYGTQATTTEADDRTPPKDQTSFPPDMMPDQMMSIAELGAAKGFFLDKFKFQKHLKKIHMRLGCRLGGLSR